MQQLIIVRHAQAAFAGADFDRELTAAGVCQAQQQGRWLKQRQLLPDQVLSSPACRAETTARSMLGTLAPDVVLQFEKTIYEASAGELIELFAQHRTAPCLMLVGHNPGVSSLVTVLTGQAVSLSPASLAVVEMIDPGIEPNGARLLAVQHCDPIER